VFLFGWDNTKFLKLKVLERYILMYHWKMAIKIKKKYQLVNLQPDTVQDVDVIRKELYFTSRDDVIKKLVRDYFSNKK